jgi:H+/Cl- antiporter ClcA
VRAPLTGIVLVAEMTASFNLLPVLIVTCMTASITAQVARKQTDLRSSPRPRPR